MSTTAPSPSSTAALGGGAVLDEAPIDHAERWQWHRSGAAFWCSFIRLTDLAVQHARIAGELGMVIEARSQAAAAALSSSTATPLNVPLLADHQLRHRLRQEEGRLLRALFEEMSCGLQAMHTLRRHPVTSDELVGTAVVYMVEMLTEDVILSFLCYQPSGWQDMEGDRHRDGSGKEEEEEEGDFPYAPSVDYPARMEDADKNASFPTRMGGEGRLETTRMQPPSFSHALNKAEKKEAEKGARQKSVPSEPPRILLEAEEEEGQQLLSPIALTRLQDPDAIDGTGMSRRAAVPPDRGLALLQAILALVERLDEDEYLDSDLLPRPLAASLLRKIQALRVAYGQRQHAKEVQRLRRLKRKGESVRP